MKISFVTAAMLYSSRRARQSFSIKAVLPDPTGLQKKHIKILSIFLLLLLLLFRRSLFM